MESDFVTAGQRMSFHPHRAAQDLCPSSLFMLEYVPAAMRRAVAMMKQSYSPQLIQIRSATFVRNRATCASVCC